MHPNQIEGLDFAKKHRMLAESILDAYDGSKLYAYLHTADTIFDFPLPFYMPGTLNF
jgi:hypothetical protein